MIWIVVVLVVYVAAILWQRFKPVPDGLHGPPVRTFDVPAERVRLLFDETRYEDGERVHESRIVERILERLRGAEQAVLDVFLVDLHGTGDQTGRPDTRRLADAVRESGVRLCLLADPVNTLYGTRENPPFEWLAEAGARVVQVDLGTLRHNNLLYAPLYALLAPFLPRRRILRDRIRGEGRLAPYALATALAARGDHRKVLVTRTNGVCSALVASGNLSDSTAFYDNVAVEVDDPGVAAFLLVAERTLARASGVDLDWSCEHATREEAVVADGPLGADRVRVTPLMGAAIGRAIVADLQRARAGDRLVVGVLFLSSRACIRELVSARRRGVDVHVVLDNNQESFGADAGGFPNRVVARELMRTAPGIDVRWHRTENEFHTKLVYLAREERRVVHAGSANLTRRSLTGTNLETNLRLEMAAASEPGRVADAYAARLVSDACSRPAEADGLPRWWHTGYRVLERIGLINC